MTQQDLAVQLSAAALLTLWVYYVTSGISRRYYESALRAVKDEGMAKYLTRKLVHILAGGVPAALTPLLFNSPVYPVLMAALVTAYVALRRRLMPMRWFQEPGNRNEITFSAMWGVAMLLSWLLTGDLIAGSIAALYMSLGDGVTGVVRSRHGRREKMWDGTLAMLAVCSALGLAGAGAAGLASAVASSLVERLRAIDDNVTVPLTAVIIVAAVRLLAPWLATPVRLSLP